MVIERPPGEVVLPKADSLVFLSMGWIVFYTNSDANGLSPSLFLPTRAYPPTREREENRRGVGAQTRKQSKLKLRDKSAEKILVTAVAFGIS